MKNLTISIQDDQLEALKAKAGEKGISMNALLRQAIDQLIGKPNQPNFVDEMRQIVRQSGKRLEGKPLTREELYDR